MQLLRSDTHVGSGCAKIRQLKKVEEEEEEKEEEEEGGR